jgi:nucleoside 2-deoxyribosyltransferase
MIKVYTAAKLATAPEWADICANTTDLFFHARWLKHTRLGTPDDNPADARMFWLEDEQDVKTADAVLVFGKHDEKLRGALVEAGIAIATGIPVFVVGDHPDYGTWKYHPCVVRCLSLADALHKLSLLNSQKFHSHEPSLWDAL